jgi:hypothetical protein
MRDVRDKDRRKFPICWHHMTLMAYDANISI